MNRYLPFLLLAACFLLLKLSNLGIRLSDKNIYFYTGLQLLKGNMLYKDVFFTNFPLFPYVSSLYVLLSFKQLPLFFFTAVIEASLVGFLLYSIILKQTKHMLTATLSAMVYLFSFMILSTTDHQTGVFLASVFAVASYYFYTEKKYLLTGICVALALLTKAYFLPVFLTYIFVLLFKQNRGEDSEKNVRNPERSDGSLGNRSLVSTQNDRLGFFIGFTVTLLLVLLPSLFFAPSDFFHNVFEYSLTRSQGIGKGNLLWFFITHDLLLFTAFIYSLISIRKHLFLGIFSIFSLLFIFLYQDIYYLYLNFMLPFLVLSFANLYRDLEQKISMQKMIIPTIIIIFLLINLGIYISGYRNLQKIENIEHLTTAIEENNPPALYGINSLTPALAYLTATPLLNSTVDTNPNIYRKGFLSAETMTRDAIDQGALFVTQGLFYPEFGVEQPVTDEIFDMEQMGNCRLMQSIPIQNEGPQNRINLVQCK